jgi:hypothetical protein
MSNNITVTYDNGEYEYGDPNGYYLTTTYNPYSDAIPTNSVTGWYYNRFIPILSDDNTGTTFNATITINVEGFYYLMIIGPGGGPGGGGSSNPGYGSNGGGGAAQCIMQQITLNPTSSVTINLPIQFGSAASATVAVDNSFYNEEILGIEFTMNPASGNNGWAGSSNGNGGNGGNGGWGGNVKYSSGSSSDVPAAPVFLGGGGGNGGVYGGANNTEKQSGFAGDPGNSNTTSQSTVGALPAGSAAYNFPDGTLGYLVRGGSQNYAAVQLMSEFMIYYYDA